MRRQGTCSRIDADRWDLRSLGTAAAAAAPDAAAAAGRAAAEAGARAAAAETGAAALHVRLDAAEAAAAARADAARADAEELRGRLEARAAAAQERAAAAEASQVASVPNMPLLAAVTPWQCHGAQLDKQRVWSVSLQHGCLWSHAGKPDPTQAALV